MRRLFRRLAGLFVLGLSASLSAVPLSAQTYPDKPITLVVPFSAGGSSDVIARLTAEKMGEVLGHRFVIENVGGAGGAIALGRVAAAAPDGYTVTIGNAGTNAAAYTIGTNLKYGPQSFLPVGLVTKTFAILAVKKAHQASTLAEFLAYAKANPGKVTFGSAGNGSSNHLSGEALKLVTGAPMQHIPYRGSALALADVMAGNITFMFDALVTGMPPVQAGRVKALAVTSERRSPYASQVPTMAEAGIKGFSEVSTDMWFGMVGPAGLPKPVLAKLNESLIRALRSTEVRERVAAQGFELWTSTSEEFAAVIRADRDKWGRIVKASGAKID